MGNEAEQAFTLVDKFVSTLSNTQLVRDFLDELQPYDKANLYRDLPNRWQMDFLHALHQEEIAEVLQQLEEAEQAAMMEQLGVSRTSEALNLMAADDVADLLGSMESEEAKALLTTMEASEANKVIELMRFPEDTAGGIMTNEFVWIPDDYNVGEAIEKLRTFAKIAESIYYLYVLDRDKRLIGALSIRDLLLSPDRRPITEIMFERVISVSPFTDQEEVAKTMERYDFVALPVVDEHNKMLGIVTIDDAIDVVLEEAREDISRFSAAGVNTPLHARPFYSAFRRLPWLILLLFIGMISGTIISRFQHTLQQVVSLAFFMPMIAGMTGNTGTQSLAVVIQGLATGQLKKDEVFRLVRREAGVGLIIGSVCGILISIIAMAWQHSPRLGLVVGFSLFCTLIIGTLAGTIIPIVLHYLKIDPAVASGPLITTLNDIFSLLIYFGIATMFLVHLM